MKKLLVVLVMWFAIYGVAIAAVNINTATKEELTSLKGIGEKRAQDIIDYRTKNGPFKSVDDLEKVPGIGPGRILPSTPVGRMHCHAVLSPGPGRSARSRRAPTG